MTPVYVDGAATLSSRCEKGESAAPAGGMPLATGPKIGGNADRTPCTRNSRIAQRFTRLSPGSSRRPRSRHRAPRLGRGCPELSAETLAMSAPATDERAPGTRCGLLSSIGSRRAGLS